MPSHSSGTGIVYGRGERPKSLKWDTSKDKGKTVKSEAIWLFKGQSLDGRHCLKSLDLSLWILQERNSHKWWGHVELGLWLWTKAGLPISLSFPFKHPLPVVSQKPIHTFLLNRLTIEMSCFVSLINPELKAESRCSWVWTMKCLAQEQHREMSFEVEQAKQNNLLICTSDEWGFYSTNLTHVI